MSLLPKPVVDVVFCEVENGAVLLHAAQEVYYGLNQVGAEIWQLLPPASAEIDGLLASLQTRYPEVPVTMLRDDVDALLTDLAAHGLVETPA